MQVVVILATTIIIAAGAASVLAVVFGYDQRWTYCVNRNVSPAFNIRSIINPFFKVSLPYPTLLLI